jgi:hypothetical protein
MNMSYCRWRNTLTDLRDCKGDLDDRRSRAEREPLSNEELQAAKSLLALAMEMVSDIARDMNISEDELIDSPNILDSYWEDLQIQCIEHEEE